MSFLNILVCVPFSRWTKLGIVLLLQLILFPKTSVAATSYEIEPETNICPHQKSIPERSFETQKYRAYICAGDKKNPLGYFVRTVKNDNNKITVPLTHKRAENYTASTEAISYIINPYELLIYKNKRLVLRDRTIASRTKDGKTLSSACLNGEAPVVEALTRNFLAYICQNSSQKMANNQPFSLHIIARKGSQRITAPLKKVDDFNSTNDKSQKYIAVKGKLQYILTPQMLKIWLDPKTSVKEKVIEWN